jgi:hypothetical protein
VYDKNIEPSFLTKIHKPAVNIHEIAKKNIKKNITSLWNQSKSPFHIQGTLVDTAKTIETSSIYLMTQIYADIEEQLDNNEGWDAHIRLDSNKPCWELDDKGEDNEDKANVYISII